MENNFDIDNATSVDEATKKMERESYDVVVSDYEMPQKNGLDFLKEIRENNNQISFILFTGKGREDVAVKALNLGADRYLNKNGSPETVYCELADAIKKTVEQKKSAQLLAASNSKYRLLVEKSLQGIMIAQNAPLRIAFANVAMGKMLGYKPEEFTSLSPEEISALIHPEDRAAFFSRFRNRLEGKEAENNYEFRAVRKDGSLIWMEAFASAIEYNRQPAVQAMFLDIDERKKGEEAVKKSEARYRELANFLPEIVFETDLSGKITFFSQTAFELTGYTPEELEEGMNMLQFVVPEDRERAKENIRRRMAGEKTASSEYTLFRKNGDTYPAIVKTAPIFFDNRLRGLRGLVIDITERKKAEEALADSETKYRALVENADDSILLTDLRGNHIYRNRAYYKGLGYEEGDNIELNSFFKVHPDDAPIVREKMSELLRTGIAVSEYRVKHRDGRWMHRFAKSTLIYNAHSQPYAILAIIRDVTERKNTEEALRKSEKEYSALFANMIDGFAFCQMLFDEKGKPTDFVYLQINDAFEKITGLKSHLVVGKKVTEVIPGIREENSELFEIYGKVASTGQKKKFEVFFKPLSLWLSISAYCPKKGYFAAIFEDITERKKSKFSLNESEEKFRNLAEKSPNMIFINQKGRVVFANKKCSDIIGYTQAEFCSPTFNFLSIIAPESVELLKSSFAAHMRGEELPAYEYSIINKFGQRIEAIINTKLIEYNGEQAILGIITDITEREKAKKELQESEERFRSLFEKAPLPVAITSLDGTIFDANISMQKFIGSSLAELKKNSVLLLYENPQDRETLCEILKQNDVVTDFPTRLKRKDGTCVDVVLNVSKFQIGKESLLRTTVQDVTERKKAEETLNDVVNQLVLVNEKLGVVGSLTRHDVRNKLSAITGYAYLLKKKHPDQIDVLDGLSKMEQAVKDSMEIFDFAKMYEQLGVEELSYISLEKAIDEAITLLSGLNIKVVNDCHGLNVLADSLLRQLLYNFIDNTRKYGKKTTTIRVQYQLANSSELQLIYEDDGVGIPAENKSELFSEGFSTGGSTGYGLFLIAKMMEIYDWKIEENGEPGKGAKFTITIPKLNRKGKENYQIVP
jgi:PAS domain S-box-containing protein